jgi:hypothetical protein
MTRLTRTSRMIAVLTLALQITMPGAAAVADARLEAASERATPHFESHPTAACVVLHADNCALCRFLSTAQPLANRQVMVLPDVAPQVAPAPEHSIRLTRSGPRTPPARAPPLA